MRAWRRPSTWSAPSVTPKAGCRSRTHMRARWSTPASAISTSTWTSAKASPAAGTPCARCGCFAGRTSHEVRAVHAWPWDGKALALSRFASSARHGGEDLYDELGAREHCRRLRRDELVRERYVAYAIQLERP